MSYSGFIIAHLRDGTAVRRLADGEVEQRGEVRYRVDGKSHWFPAAFFVEEANRLALLSQQMREAAMLIESYERTAH